MAEQRAGLDRVELVRRWVDELPQGDWVSQREELLDRIRAQLAPITTDDFEIAPLGTGDGGLLAPGRGAEGVVAFWRDWLEPWVSFSVQFGQVSEGRSGVMVEAVQRGQMRGATVDARSAAVYFFRGDRLARMELHFDRERAREAAGLPTGETAHG